MVKRLKLQKEVILTGGGGKKPKACEGSIPNS